MLSYRQPPNPHARLLECREASCPALRKPSATSAERKLSTRNLKRRSAAATHAREQPLRRIGGPLRHPWPLNPDRLSEYLSASSRPLPSRPRSRPESADVMQGTPPICRGSTVIRLNFIGKLLLPHQWPTNQQRLSRRCPPQR